MKLSFGPSQDAHLDAELLSAYLDGQVRPEERRRVEAHLGSCSACQQELDSLRQTVEMLHALPRVPTPRAFTLSEAQVGLRKPAAVGRPGWFDGLVRGLAAAGAVVLVAVTAAVLLRQPAWQPSQNLARLADPAPAAEQAMAHPQPTEAATPPQMPAAPAAPATSTDPAPAAAPPAAAPPTPASKAAGAAPAAAAKAPAPTAALPVTAQPVAKLPEKAAESTASAAAGPTRPAARTQPEPTAAPTVTAATPAPLAADRPPAAAAMAAAGAPTMTVTTARSAQVTGMAAAADAAKSELVVAAVTTASLTALPSDAVLALADGRGVSVLDRAGGARTLAQGEGLTAPAISGDRTWVAYRQTRGNDTAVWAAPIGGGDARLLLTELDLGGDPPPGYRGRRIQELRWLPGKGALLVTVQLTPVAQGAPAQIEMWVVDVASGSRKRLSSGDARVRPAAAPDGTRIAFLRREPDRAGDAGFWLIGSDGGSERALLRFAAPADARTFAGQIAWLPDGSGLWAAIPDAQSPTALTLYRVPLNGEAQPAGRVEAQELFWAPNGARLAYTRWTGEAGGARELLLAAADGASAQPYATLANGRFIGWSPDSARFLFEDGGQLFVGSAGDKAQRLASGAIEPRWLGSNQIVYLAGQGESWQLIAQTLDGKAVTLQSAPAGTAIDSIRP